MDFAEGASASSADFGDFGGGTFGGGEAFGGGLAHRQYPARLAATLVSGVS